MVKSLKIYIILLAGLIASSCKAQGPSQTPDAVWMPLFVNPPATSLQASATIATAGLSQHRLTVYLKNAPAKTCSAQFVDIFFQASSDNVTFFEIGSPINAIVADAFGNLTGVLEAAGSYPFIRVYLRQFDFTNCVLTAFYAGSKYPNPESVAALPKASSRNLIGKTFSTASGTIAPALNSSRFTCVYGISMINTTGGGITVLIQNGPTGGPFVTKITKVLGIAGAASDSFVLGPSPFSQFCSNRGDDIFLSAGGVVSGTIQYRYEDNPQ